MKHELIGGVFWLVFGIVLCAWSSTYKIGDFTRPDTGLMPLLLGVLMIILSTVIVVRTVRSKAKKDKNDKLIKISTNDWVKKVVLTTVLLIVAALVFEWLGYLLTFALMVVAFMIVGEVKSWKQIVIAAFCTSLGIYLLFVLLLKQPLPTGILGV